MSTEDYDDYYDASKKDGERFIQGKNGGCIDRGEQRAKHTPGPWACVSGVDRGAFTVYLPSDGMVICSRNQYESKHAEFLANARLIAAAPDLLEALQALVAIDDGDSPDLWRYTTEFEAAREVIARATGEQS